MHYTRLAQDDLAVLKRQGDARLLDRVHALLKIIELNPLSLTPPFKKLTGDLQGCYSRRLNKCDRLIYQVLEEQRAIKVLSMRSHYSD